MTQTKYLIIGNSIAGINCIEAIREVDKKGKVVVISEEEILNYSRPLISYYLGGKIPKEKMSFRDEEFYRENKVKVLLNTKADKLDIKKKETHFNHQKIKFEKLLIATGGKPIIPPIENLEKIKEGIFTFTNFSSTQKLIDYIEKNKIKEAVVLGAGLIGLKCTEGLVERKVKVTLVELADKILANTFDKEASQILENALSKLGCKVIKEDTIVRVEGVRRLTKVILRSERELPTQLLIIAVGVRPNLDLIKDTPISFERGIIVNDCMQTNVKDIYAAGDVAQGKDFLMQKNSVIAIWPIAARQGKIAGFNMAGKKVSYEGLFIMNSVELVEIPTISFGITNPSNEKDYEILIKKDKENNFYRKIVLRDNRILGAIFLGKIERAGIFLGLIKDKIDVSSFKEDLLSDEFGFLILPAEYRKHLVKGEGIEV
ncbi:MAG TPA: NAD(P)/FAD-dependent oxidoreductase [Candidatus Omnitrophica bacterium]|nr:NAD(P)/FAD-dependent oxidoreductase [Candidatus Omnitrophota bacterium]